MNCPNCHAAMKSVTYEGAEVHACTSCGGEFVAATELAHVVRSREERFGSEVADEIAQREPAFGVPVDESERKLECPACENGMKVINYGVDTGIFVDSCSVCGGVWLDKGELEKVQTIMERWAEEAPEKVRGAAMELEKIRTEAANESDGFHSSRFSFVNAVMNRILDAA